MSRRGPGRRNVCSRYTVMTLLACVSVVAVVQPTSSLPPPRRDLFFDDTPRDGETVTATRGSQVVLNCQAIGTPIPTVHWLHRGRRVIQGERDDVRDDTADYESTSDDGDSAARDKVLKLGTTKSRLFIDCVRPSDAGRYTCVAETPTMRIVTTTVLQVVPETRKRLKMKLHRNQNLLMKRRERAIRKKEISSDSCHNKRDKSNRAPARVYMWTSQRLAATGHNAQLYCRASGNPQPTVTWYDPDEQEILSDNNKYKVLPNGDLLINDVVWPEDMGLYYCKVRNSVGSDAVDMFVYPTTT